MEAIAVAETGGRMFTHGSDAPAEHAVVMAANASSRITF